MLFFQLSEMFCKVGVLPIAFCGRLAQHGDGAVCRGYFLFQLIAFAPRDIECGT